MMLAVNGWQVDFIHPGCSSPLQNGWQVVFEILEIKMRMRIYQFHKC
jgi:hypothetical protein